MPSKLVVGYSAACKKTMSYSSKNIKYSSANVSKKAKFSLDNVFCLKLTNKEETSCYFVIYQQLCC